MASLIEHAKNGRLDEIRSSVIEGCDVNYRCPPDGTTALYWAACNGHLSTCDWLIRHGAEVNLSVEKSGSIPLHGAADRGHQDCVLLLVRSGSDIDLQTKSNGDTPLHLAAYRGKTVICRLLLQYGACAEIVNAQGFTALDECRKQNHYDTFQLLSKYRQRCPCSRRIQKSDTCELYPDTRNDSTVCQKSKKSLTEVISTSFNPIVPHPTCHNSKHVNGSDLTNPAVNHDHHVKKSTVDITNHHKGEDSIRSLIHSAETNDRLQESNTFSYDRLSPILHSPNISPKTDDVINDLVRKYDHLVAYLSSLQVELTLREDEKMGLVKTNAILMERLEYCRKIAEATEEANRARMESEKRALRAESELVQMKKRYEALQKINRNGLHEHESRLFATDDCNSKTFLPSNSNHKFTSNDNDELQPR